MRTNRNTVDISIIIPTYRAANTLSTALNSIIEQKYAHFEIIIVDAASDDETLCIADSFKDKHSDIKIISEPDKGVYDAMNKGIKMAKGEWVYFIGADDYFFNDRVLTDIFLAPNVSKYHVIYGSVYSPVLGEKYDGEFDKTKIANKNICHQSIFYRRDLFKRLGDFNTNYKIFADWEFNLRWFNRKSVKRKYVDITIAFFASDGLSSFGQLDPAFKADKIKLLKKYGFRKRSIKKAIVQVLRKIKAHINFV